MKDGSDPVERSLDHWSKGVESRGGVSLVVIENSVFVWWWTGVNVE